MGLMPCHDELICPCLGLKKHHLYHQSLNAPPASVPRVLSKQPCDISTPDLPSLAEGRGVIRTKKLGLNPHKRGDHNRLFFCCPVLAPALPIVQSIDIMISPPSCWQVADKKRVVVTRVMMMRWSLVPVPGCGDTAPGSGVIIEISQFLAL